MIFIFGWSILLLFHMDHTIAKSVRIDFPSDDNGRECQDWSLQFDWQETEQWRDSCCYFGRSYEVISLTSQSGSSLVLHSQVYLLMVFWGWGHGQDYLSQKYHFYSDPEWYRDRKQRETERGPLAKDCIGAKYLHPRVTYYKDELQNGLYRC